MSAPGCPLCGKPLDGQEGRPVPMMSRMAEPLYCKDQWLVTPKYAWGPDAVEVVTAETPEGALDASILG